VVEKWSTLRRHLVFDGIRGLSGCDWN